MLVGRIESAHHPIASALDRKVRKNFEEFEDAT
jgi:hypothetical protein